MARANPHPSYDVTSNTYILKRQGLKDKHWETEIGDITDASRFQPRWLVRRWLDDANFGLDLPQNFLGGGDNVTHDGEAIVWTRSNVTARFFDWANDPDDIEGNGSYEWEIIFANPLPTNSITLPIRRKNIELLYQPPLTAQEIADGVVRPPRVEGSYAVYSSTKQGKNPGDPIDYQVGKIGHLYRPLVRDNAGRTTWATFNTDAQTTGTLTITIDPAWLAAAVYPVTIDPTFGYTTAGASSDGTSTTLAWAVRKGALQYTGVTGDVVTKLWAYTVKSWGSPTGQLALYDVTSNVPVNLITSGTFTPPASAGWAGPTISQSLTNGTVYTVAHANATSSNNYNKYYDTGAVFDSSRCTISGNAFANPWGTETTGTQLWSIYATYTAQFTKTLSASARVVGRITKTVGASARLLKQSTLTFSASARKMARSTLTASASALLQAAGGITTTFSASGHLLKQSALTAGASAHLLATLTLTTGASAHLLKTSTLTADADAHLVTRQEVSHEASAHLQDTVDITSDASAHLKATATVETDASAHLSQQVEVTTDSSAHLQATVDLTTGGSGHLQSTVTVDTDASAYLSQQVELTADGSAHLLKQVERNVDGSARLLSQTELSTSASGRLRDLGIALETDATARLMQRVERNTDASARLISQTTVDTDASAYLSQQVEVTTDGSAHLRSTVERNTEASGILVKQHEVTTDTAAKLIFGYPLDLVFDASGHLIGTYSVDTGASALVVNSYTLDTGASAKLVHSRRQVIYASANLVEDISYADVDIVPSADLLTQLTPSAPVSHFQLLNDQESYSTSNYVEMETEDGVGEFGKTDWFEFTDVSAADIRGTITKITVHTVAAALHSNDENEEHVFWVQLECTDFTYTSDEIDPWLGVAGEHDSTFDVERKSASPGGFFTRADINEMTGRYYVTVLAPAIGTGRLRIYASWITLEFAGDVGSSVPRLDTPSAKDLWVLEFGASAKIQHPQGVLPMYGRALLVNQNYIWRGLVGNMHQYFRLADAALVSMFQDATITDTNLSQLVTWLGSVTFEATIRDPWLHGKGTFPRVHVFTDRAGTVQDETNTTVGVDPTATLAVWTYNADPTTAASQNVAICGALAAFVQQTYKAKETNWMITHANWGEPTVRVLTTEFVDSGDMAGLCRGVVEVTWQHRDWT